MYNAAKYLKIQHSDHMKPSPNSSKGEDLVEESYLGQFIPLHYHHNMLMDEDRMVSFKAAIDQTVFEGAKVLELGGGTGVLSCFAAAKASRVWCVEFNPELVAESRRLLRLNPNGEKVEVIHANAFDYLPPEPVDVVICEMIHSAMLREKQVELMESFKRRYIQRFGEKLPVFIPAAVIMAVQPVQQNYNFFDFYAPIIQFQPGDSLPSNTIALAPYAIYSVLDFSQPTPLEIQWRGPFTFEENGLLNAFRFITKVVLAILPDKGTTIDWMANHIVVPMQQQLEVEIGQKIELAFHYSAGGSLRSLENSMTHNMLIKNHRFSDRG